METCVIFVIYNFLFEFDHWWFQKELWLFSIAGDNFAYHIILDEILNKNWKLKFVEPWYTWLKK